jgi:predicted signal transduction protein with EAL and GGDEF domain
LTAEQDARWPRALEAVAEPFDLDGHAVGIGTSIGIALAPQDGVAPSELMKKAELALYQAKADGRNSFSFFDARMTKEADARHQLEIEMREAILREEFELHYQPLIDVATGRACGAEA